MGFQINYAATIGQVKAMVQAMFEKMSEHCRFVDRHPDIIAVNGSQKDCLYYGRSAKHICDRELCPILEEE